MNSFKSASARTAFVLALLFLTGCGIWTDFTTYFNLYYNASKLFEETEEEIELKRKDRFLFKQEKLASTISQNLVKVIEKSSAILHDHSSSSYFDRALLMIGKSFYYQEDYSKAKRKFSELVGFEETELHMNLESTLWLAKSELQLRNFDTGLKLLEEVKKKGREFEETEILEESYVTEIGFYIYRENFNRAILLLTEMRKLAEDDELKAELLYQLGLLYLKQDDISNAAEAFAAVSEYSPSFEIEFNSKLENAKLQKKLGNPDLSLELLEELLDEDKNSDKFDVLEFESALIYYEKNDIDEAMERFYDIDTTYKSTPSAGQASYMMGVILEKRFFNYDSAKYHYDKARTTQLPEEYKEDAQKKSELFSKYNKISDDIYNFERQLYYLENPEIYQQDSTAWAEYTKQDSTLLQEGEEGKEKLTVDTGEKKDELSDDQEEQQENSETEEETVTEDQEEEISEGDENWNDDFGEEKIIPVQPVKPLFEKDSLYSLITTNEFELGNLFLTEFEVPDSAVFYYSKLEHEYPDLKFRPKLLFAIGSYFANIGEKERADSMFNLVYNNYRLDRIANEAATKLGYEQIDFGSDPAEMTYSNAEEFYLDGNFETAIDSFYYLTENYPESHLVARSYYAIGKILEENLQLYDSAAVVYDTLVSRYNNTDYSRAVKPRLNSYKQEQKRVIDSIKAFEKRIADSIKAEEKKLADSLAAANKQLSADSLSTSSDSLSVPSDSLSTGQSIPDSLSATKPDSVSATELKAVEDSSAAIRDSIDRKNKRFK